jgi:WD40 repeat protein
MTFRVSALAGSFPRQRGKLWRLIAAVVTLWPCAASALQRIRAHLRKNGRDLSFSWGMPGRFGLWRSRRTAGKWLPGAWTVHRIWDVASGNLLRTFTGHSKWVFSVAYSPDGQYLLTGAMKRAGGLDATSRKWVEFRRSQKTCQITGKPQVRRHSDRAASVPTNGRRR